MTTDHEALVKRLEDGDYYKGSDAFWEIDDGKVDSLCAEAAAAITNLTALVREAREALDPLSYEASRYDPEDGEYDDDAWVTHLRVGQLRFARSVLVKLKEFS